MSITSCHQVNAGCLSPFPHITVQVQQEILKLCTAQTLPLFIFSDVFFFFLDAQGNAVTVLGEM